MSDNVSAKKKLESKEKARKAEEERREKIKAQKLRGVDTSDGKVKFMQNESCLNPFLQLINLDQKKIKILWMTC